MSVEIVVDMLDACKNTVVSLKLKQADVEVSSE